MRAKQANLQPIQAQDKVSRKANRMSVDRDIAEAVSKKALTLEAKGMKDIDSGSDKSTSDAEGMDWQGNLETGEEYSGSDEGMEDNPR